VGPRGRHGLEVAARSGALQLTTLDRTITFSNDTSNPLDSGFGFANAALGVFSSYNQFSRYVEGSFVYDNTEGYIQDNWKIANRLTLDFGVRLVRQQPQYDKLGQASNFLPDRWIQRPGRRRQRVSGAAHGADADKILVLTRDGSGVLLGSGGSGVLLGSEGSRIPEPDRTPNPRNPRNPREPRNLRNPRNPRNQHDRSERCMHVQPVAPTFPLRHAAGRRHPAGWLRQQPVVDVPRLSVPQ
jgi:hypothetical protein